jgi:hypothetical protein
LRENELDCYQLKAKFQIWSEALQLRVSPNDREREREIYDLVSESDSGKSSVFGRNEELSAELFHALLCGLEGTAEEEPIVKRLGCIRCSFVH